MGLLSRTAATLRRAVTGSRPASDRDEEWRDRLSPEEYRVLRQCGTESPGSSDLLDVDRAGRFRCAGCGAELFRTDEKYHSGTGWPSFWAPSDDDAVETRSESGLLDSRTEVVCADCGGHLGHVFADGPEPTGLRYCINGVALAFDADGDGDGDANTDDGTGSRAD